MIVSRGLFPRNGVLIVQWLKYTGEQFKPHNGQNTRSHGHIITGVLQHMKKTDFINKIIEYNGVQTNNKNVYEMENGNFENFIFDVDNVEMFKNGNDYIFKFGTCEIVIKITATKTQYKHGKCKLKNVFDLWMDGKINETEIERKNKTLFDKINDEIETINKPINIDIEMLMYCDFDFECLYDNLYDGFMDGIKTYINDVLRIAEKYKNENVNI